MGCSISRLDDLPAVALCRDRCNFLGDAIHEHCALAEAHSAYLLSLRRVALSLHRFFDHPLPRASADQSCSGSHLHFPSDSDDEPPSHSTAFSSPSRPKSQGDQREAPVYSNDFSSALAGGAVVSSASPPPPDPPNHSAWDFLNFFDAYDGYDPSAYGYNPNRNPEGTEVATAVDLEDHRRMRNRKPKTAKKAVKDDACVRDEEVKGPASSSPAAPSVTDLMKEVQALLERASESGDEVSKMFEAGTLHLHLHQKNAASQVSCRLLNAMASASTNPVGLESEEAPGTTMDAGTLSSAVEKLCTWENKLYREVKAEEKLRMIHQKKCRQLKSMNEKFAAASKIDSTRSLLAASYAKIKISIQVVDKISVTINKLRDEELWPHIDKLINGLTRMWRAMLSCHRSLSKAVAESKALDVIKAETRLSVAHLEDIIQLKLEVQNWNLRFSNWMDHQKGYVNALNGWLLKCLFEEPNETLDGLAPNSPGSIGAPPVFLISKQWSQALERLSGKEVIEAMQVLYVSLNQLSEHSNVELQQRMLVDKDLERRMKVIEREDQKVHKLMQARDKKMLLAFSGDVHSSRLKILHPGVGGSDGGLHSGLKQVFKAMESLADKSMQAYEELCLRIDEESRSQGNPKVT